MEGNRDAAYKCIENAQKALDAPNLKNIDNVKKLLNKAKRLYPTQEAEGTISSLLYQHKANHPAYSLLLLLNSKSRKIEMWQIVVKLAHLWSLLLFPDKNLQIH